MVEYGMMGYLMEIGELKKNIYRSMTIKNYTQYLVESSEYEDYQNAPEYKEISNDLQKMIKKSLKTSDFQTKKDFIKAYLIDPEKNQIEGLINDSDVYEFYLRHRGAIDEILSDIKFYEEAPLEISGLYDYTIVGTKRAIKSILSNI
jgi:hypothetical protein